MSSFTAKYWWCISGVFAAVLACEARDAEICRAEQKLHDGTQLLQKVDPKDEARVISKGVMLERPQEQGSIGEIARHMPMKPVSMPTGSADGADARARPRTFSALERSSALVQVKESTKYESESEESGDDQEEEAPSEETNEESEEASNEDASNEEGSEKKEEAENEEDSTNDESAEAEAENGESEKSNEEGSKADEGSEAEANNDQTEKSEEDKKKEADNSDEEEKDGKAVKAKKKKKKGTTEKKTEKKKMPKKKKKGGLNLARKEAESDKGEDEGEDENKASVKATSQDNALRLPFSEDGDNWQPKKSLPNGDLVQDSDEEKQVSGDDAKQKAGTKDYGKALKFELGDLVKLSEKSVAEWKEEWKTDALCPGDVGTIVGKSGKFFVVQGPQKTHTEYLAAELKKANSAPDRLAAAKAKVEILEKVIANRSKKSHVGGDFDLEAKLTTMAASMKEQANRLHKIEQDQVLAVEGKMKEQLRTLNATAEVLRKDYMPVQEEQEALDYLAYLNGLTQPKLKDKALAMGIRREEVLQADEDVEDARKALIKLILTRKAAEQRLAQLAREREWKRKQAALAAEQHHSAGTMKKKKVSALKKTKQFNFAEKAAMVGMMSMPVVFCLLGLIALLCMFRRPQAPPAVTREDVIKEVLAARQMEENEKREKEKTNIASNAAAPDGALDGPQVPIPASLPPESPDYFLLERAPTHERAVSTKVEFAHLHEDSSQGVLQNQGMSDPSLQNQGISDTSMVNPPQDGLRKVEDAPTQQATQALVHVTAAVEQQSQPTLALAAPAPQAVGNMTGAGTTPLALAAPAPQAVGNMTGAAAAPQVFENMTGAGTTPLALAAPAPQAVQNMTGAAAAPQVVENMTGAGTTPLALAAPAPQAVEIKTGAAAAPQVVESMTGAGTTPLALAAPAPQAVENTTGAAEAPQVVENMTGSGTTPVALAAPAPQAVENMTGAAAAPQVVEDMTGAAAAPQVFENMAGAPPAPQTVDNMAGEKEGAAGIANASNPSTNSRGEANIESIPQREASPGLRNSQPIEDDSGVPPNPNLK